MKKIASTSRSPRGGSSRYTGMVAIDRRLSTATDQVIRSTAVFEPASRTAWHISPRGLTIIVKMGEGRLQLWGEPIRELVAGDVVRIEPGIKHWHGAAPNVGATLFTIEEALDGQTAEWLEGVTDEQYHSDLAPALR